MYKISREQVGMSILYMEKKKKREKTLGHLVLSCIIVQSVFYSDNVPGSFTGCCHFVRRQKER